MSESYYYPNFLNSNLMELCGKKQITINRKNWKNITLSLTKKEVADD